MHKTPRHVVGSLKSVFGRRLHENMDPSDMIINIDDSITSMIDMLGCYSPRVVGMGTPQLCDLVCSNIELY